MNSAQIPLHWALVRAKDAYATDSAHRKQEIIGPILPVPCRGYSDRRDLLFNARLHWRGDWTRKPAEAELRALTHAFVPLQVGHAESAELLPEVIFLEDNSYGRMSHQCRSDDLLLQHGIFSLPLSQIVSGSCGRRFFV